MQVDLQPDQIVAEAASWYRSNRSTCERPIIPALRRRFPLSAKQACEVIFLANSMGGADVAAS